MDRKRSKSREGRGAREGGETSCEWRRKGSADDETGTCGSACALHVFIIDTTCACTRRGGEGAGGGGGEHGALLLRRRVTANTHK